MTIGQVTEEINWVTLMYPTFCLLQDILTKEIIGHGTKKRGLYYMDDFSSSQAHHMHHASIKERRIWLWHRCLGHPSFSYMKYLFPDLFSKLPDSDLKCDTCILAKSHLVSYSTSLNKSDIPFALIHSYVWEPSPIITSFGIRWFVTFINDCTLYMLKQKDDVFSVFQSFHTMIQTQFSANIQILRFNNSGEYVNKKFQDYFATHGLLHKNSCAQTPQKNGVAERKNQLILETARALLLGAHVPSRYWDDAIATTVYLLNRMPSKVL